MWTNETTMHATGPRVDANRQAKELGQLGSLNASDLMDRSDEIKAALDSEYFFVRIAGLNVLHDLGVKMVEEYELLDPDKQAKVGWLKDQAARVSADVFRKAETGNEQIAALTAISVHAGRQARKELLDLPGYAKNSDVAAYANAVLAGNLGASA